MTPGVEGKKKARRRSGRFDEMDQLVYLPSVTRRISVLVPFIHLFHPLSSILLPYSHVPGGVYRSRSLYFM